MLAKINTAINNQFRTKNSSRTTPDNSYSAIRGVVLKFRKPLTQDTVSFGSSPLPKVAPPQITLQADTVKALFGTLKNLSAEIVRQIKPYEPVLQKSGLKKITTAFSEALNPKSEIFKESIGDLKFILEKDPALKEKDEKEALAYQSLVITFAHRVAHDFYKKGDTTIARFVSESAKKLTGAELHPGATIGKKVFIDHPTGLVVGEATKIGNRFHGHGNVILGSDGVNAGKNRHPLIGENVTIWPHAKIHGNKTIGDGAVIGCNATVTENVPEHSVIVGHNILAQLDGKKVKIHLKDYWDTLNGSSDINNLAV